MNKNGAVNYFAVFVVIALLAIGYFVSPYSKTAPEASTVITPTPAGTPVAPATSCPYAPTESVSGIDAITLAAATPTTVNYIVNGVHFGTSAPLVKQGDSWTIVGDLASYLADTQTFTIGCGVNPLTTHPYAYANATVTIKDDIVTSSNTLTNGGGANNFTKFNGQRNLPVIFQGTSQKSTGKIFWIFESAAGMAVNITSVTASCNGAALSPMAIPSAVAAANAGSYRQAFEVPAVIGSTTTTCNLQIQSTASGTVSGLQKNTFYAEQTYVDANGQVTSGIYDTTVNGNNAAKFQDSYTYNVQATA